MSDLDNIARRPVLAGIGATAFAAFFNASGAGLCRFAVSSTLNSAIEQVNQLSRGDTSAGAAVPRKCAWSPAHLGHHRSSGGRMGSRADQTDQQRCPGCRGPTSVRGK